MLLYLKGAPFIRLRDLLAIFFASSPFLLLVGGGIAMCFLYKPGERIDALGYWILAIMLVPYFLMALLAVIWREDEEPDGEDNEA